MNKLLINMELSEQEAEALAQMVKRLGWDDMRAKAVSDDEAYLISDAVMRLKQALAESGFDPR